MRLIVPEFSDLSFRDPFTLTPLPDLPRLDDAEGRFVGGLERVRIGDTENLAELRYHLIGFPLKAGTDEVLYPNDQVFPGRISLAADEWRIDIDVWPDWGRLRGLKRGVFPVDFVQMCRIQHKDGLLFSASNGRVESLRLTLVLFLSFVAGRSVGAALPVGFDESGEKKYVEWSCTLVDSTRNFRSWCPQDNPDCVPQLFSRFVELAREPRWHRTLVTLVRSYTAVSSLWADFGFAVGVAFIAFASLSHKILVVNEARLSNRQFKKTPTSENLRMLLERAGIPIAVPDGMSALGAAAADNDMDAPGVLAWIRNQMIHPVDSVDLHRDAVAEAWTLSLWYLELLTLHLLGYEGSYDCRVESLESPRDYPLVPWAAQSE
ncbi:MAG: hypothetical protein OXH28_06645 [bacterium]|nr:hypothetical protein [bacterium]